MSTTITLIKNSGHHYAFIRLSDFDKTKIADNQTLVQSILKSYKDACIKDEHNWKVDSENSWVRYCWGHNKNFEEGLFICIDTNCGNEKRGVVAGDPIKTTEQVSASTPYVSLGDTQSLPESITLFGHNIELEWHDGVAGTRAVDLVVDFGNSRSVVLAIEDNGNEASELSAICRPIVFLEPREEFTAGLKNQARDKHLLDRQIIDSNILMRENEFGDLSLEKAPLCKEVRTENKEEKYCETISEEIEVKKGFFGRTKKEIVSKQIERTKQVVNYVVQERYSQQFVEVSPAIMGPIASLKLSEAELGAGGSFSWSSPKRYLWDNEALKPAYGCWNMLPKGGDQHLKSLGGQIGRYTYSDGGDWEDETKPPFLNEDIADRPSAYPISPRYPRAETMVWAALNIIETAYREINSEGWRDGNAYKMRRYLNSIALTYPSGWLGAEKLAFKKAWERAAKIFAIAHLETNEKEPEVILEVDEAVASQLPFVYTAITKGHDDDRSNRTDKWIENYGHDGRVTVMTIDIGGGTMDASVVEYSNMFAGQPQMTAVGLEHNLRFRDCNSSAGDVALKNILERVLLPQLFEVLCRTDEGKRDQAKINFMDIFYNAAAMEQTEREEKSRLIKLFLMPIAKTWLKMLGKNEAYTEKTIEDFLGEAKNSTDSSINYFNNKLSVAGLNLIDIGAQTLKFDPVELEECIKDALKNGLDSLASYKDEYDVDIVVLSGKITEIPIVSKMVVDSLGLKEHHLRAMKNYETGSWYPMNVSGKVPDAKTVTAVGAALHRAFSLGRIKDWCYLPKEKTEITVDNFIYWGIMPNKTTSPGFAGEPFFTENNSEDNCVTIKINVNSKIGRMTKWVRETITRPELEYLFRWKDGKEIPNVFYVEATIERKVSDDDEFLELLAVKIYDRTRKTDGLDYKDCFELKHKTLDEDLFWIDEGHLDVCFKEETKND